MYSGCSSSGYGGLVPKGLTWSLYFSFAWILECYIMVLSSNHNKGIPMLQGTEDSTVVILYVGSVQQWVPRTHVRRRVCIDWFWYRYFSDFLRQWLRTYCWVYFLAIRNLFAIVICNPILNLFIFLVSELGENEFYNLLICIEKLSPFVCFKTTSWYFQWEVLVLCYIICLYYV